MKRKLFFIFMLAVLGTATSFGQWQFGGGLSLGTESGGTNDMGLGINARADYSINEQFIITPNFTYWFPSIDYGSLTYWQLNADVHYIFSDNGTMNFYALGGLNYSFWKYKASSSEFDEWGWGSYSYDDNKIGVNLGVGANYNMFFGELKYDTAFEQIAITIGVLF